MTLRSAGSIVPATMPSGDRRAAGRAEPTGNVVSPEGRARTIAAFGEPLSPQQVVERICADVAARGLEAVLDYSRRLDGVKLEPGQCGSRPTSCARLTDGPTRPISRRSLASAATSWRISEAILHRDVSAGAGDGDRARPVAPAAARGWASAFRAGPRRIRRAC